MDTNDQGLVLVVDDERITQRVHEAILATLYQVVVASSGQEAIDMCNSLRPNLVVMDIEMPEMNGYQTCRKIRETNTVPIIFVTANNSLESQLEAFDAGANDIITKPINRDIFLHKVGLAINSHLKYESVVHENRSLQTMAMNFLSNVGETGVLLNFLRGSITCHTYEELAEKFVEAAKSLQINCFGMIRSDEGSYDFRTNRKPSSLEQEILSKLLCMGRIFQFNKQLVVNYDRVSVVATDLPIGSAEKTGSLKDNLCVLAETTEALCENVGMRQESIKRAERLQLALVSAMAAVENLQQDHRLMLADTRVLLEGLIDQIEKAFSWLGTTNEQETAISSMTNDSIQAILDLLITRGEFEHQFTSVLDALRGTQEKGAIEVW